MAPKAVEYIVKAEDTDIIEKVSFALYNQIRSLESKPGKHFADLWSIKASVAALAAQGNLCVFYKDSDRISMVGAVASNIVLPWYTRQTCLDEIFVIQMNPQFHGFGKVALDSLKKKAKVNGCALLQTGASMTDRPEMLRNIYERKGKCTFTYQSYVWVMPH